MTDNVVGSVSVMSWQIALELSGWEQPLWLAQLPHYFFYESAQLQQAMERWEGHHSYFGV